MEVMFLLPWFCVNTLFKVIHNLCFTEYVCQIHGKTQRDPLQESKNLCNVVLMYAASIKH